jgi:hypothetical protein
VRVKKGLRAGLPDGLFSDQKSQFLVYIFFVGLGMENLGIFYIYSGTFESILRILPPVGMFCGNLVYFPHFWYVAPMKIWQPWSESAAKN